MSAGLTRIFVYGTLKRGLENHGWMRGQVFVAEAWSQPLYQMHDLGGYPGLTEADEDGGVAIQGEIWDVDADGEYELRPICLQPPWDGESVQAYFYLRSIHGKRNAGACWGRMLPGGEVTEADA